MPLPSVGNTPPVPPERDPAGGELRARTQFVASTREPIAAPYVDSHSLPRQLSIDPLSEAEIQAVRESVYRRVKRGAGREGAQPNMTVFTPRDDPDEAGRTAAADQQLARDANFKTNGERTRILYLGASRSITIVSSKAACSHVQARCRRCETTIDQPASWWTWHGIEPRRGDSERDPVAALQPYVRPRPEPR